MRDGMRAAMLLFLATVPNVHSGATGYKHKENVDVYVNKVGPWENPSVTYHYYQLPVCRPDKIVHKTLSLGEVLAGDRMAKSLFDIKFQVNQDVSNLCSTVEAKGDELAMLKDAIEENWYFEFSIDELAVRAPIGVTEQEGVFPHEHQLAVNTNYHFVIDYNGENIISITMDNGKVAPMYFAHDAQSINIEWTYTVEWRMTRTEVGDRDHVHGESSGDSTQSSRLQIHWLSVANSFLLVFMLLAFVCIVVVRMVRADLLKYNRDIDEDDIEEQMHMLDVGWKTLSGDVFRCPPHRQMLSAIVGSGYQLATLVVIVLVVGSLELVNVHKRSHLYTLAAYMYAFTSVISGYSSARQYRRLGGERWVWNVNLTSLTFILPMFTVWATINTFWWIGGSTRALPYTTVILLMLGWTCVGYPLTLIGGVIGRRAEEASGAFYQPPCRTRLLPRELPPTPFYHQPVVHAAIAGLLAFSSISVELYYVLATVWGREQYTLFHIVLISSAILVGVTMTSSIAVTYFALQQEDYRWPWRAMGCGIATGVYVFIYAIYFYMARSEMSGLLQTLQYFGYSALMAYAIGLSLAAIAYLASRRFVYYIYARIKTD